MAKRKSDAINGAVLDEIGTLSATNGTNSAKRPKTGACSSQQPDLVDEINALDAHEFQHRFLDDSCTYIFADPHHIHCTLKYAKDLRVPELDKCFNLIDTTSRKDYEPSSFGWRPKRKRREMKEKEMRYIIVHENPLYPKERAIDGAGFQGFLSFMITHDSTPAVPVLYIYEIHLVQSLRGKRVGLHLLHIAESIARKIGVKKVMLTCFLSNTNALSFYHKHGFKTDACSPGDRRTRKKVVKTDYVIMSKDVDSTTTAAITTDARTNGNGVQVMEEETTQSVTSDRTDTEFPSLDDCPAVMRAWIDSLKQQELLDLGLMEAEKARRLLSSDGGAEAAKHRDILAVLFQCLQSRYEAARDLDEILREQMYHLKSHISDVDKMAETLRESTSSSTPNGKSKVQAHLTSQIEEGFDWDKATEQVYSAFYTLLRKAEEVDNRLDDIVEREQEADQREDDLDGREEELDSWEDDIHEREKALAVREERLMRLKQRLKRLKGSGTTPITTDEQFYDDPHEWEGEQVRALPWRQEAPPQNKVDLWLHETTACDGIEIDADS